MNGKILIVEDDAITALDLKYNLEELGYEIIDIVDKGQDAIDAAFKLTPDIILMDIKLNDDISGIEVANKISPLNIQVIYLTGYIDSDTFEKSNVKCLYQYVTKPYDINKLDQIIKITLKKAQLKY